MSAAEQVGQPAKTHRVQFMIAPEDLATFNEWRWQNRIRSEAEAIRRIVLSGPALIATLRTAQQEIALLTPMAPPDADPIMLEAVAASAARADAVRATIRRAIRLAETGDA